jgi:DNA repair exonuclease SbcCD ATPase subunit
LKTISQSKKDEAEKLKKKKNPYVEALESAKNKIKKLKRIRKAKKEEISDLRKQLSSLEFWVKGFGPTGIPSFALDSIMPFITKRANYYLKQLSDGDISINFSTQRELKSSSGEFRDEIGITWMIEGIENYPPSGGQWKKMEIATNFALMDLVTTREGSHVNILCLDECLDGLDQEGRQRVVSMLHRLRKRKESIFVISHHVDMAEIFERSVMAIKEDGVSRLEKAA